MPFSTLKEIVAASGLWPQRGGRQFTWRQKSKCLFARTGEDKGIQKGILTNKLKDSSLSTYIVHATNHSDSSLPGTSSGSTAVRQLGGVNISSRVFFGAWLFLAQNNSHSKEIFWGGKFCYLQIRLSALDTPKWFMHKSKPGFLW